LPEFQPRDAVRFLSSDRAGVPDAASGGSRKDLADARARAGLDCTACTGARLYVGFCLQLPRGNCPGAETAQKQYAKERGFDLLVHGVFFLSWSITRRGACRFGECEIAHAYVGSGLRKDAGAAENLGTACIAGAEASAGGALNILGQLAGGKRSRAKNGRQHRCQPQVLEEIPAHEFVLLRG
jgi:hypothetical protein